MKKASILTGILCAAVISLAAGIPANAEEKGGQGARKVAPASIAFVPPVAGFIMAAEVVKDLIKGDRK